MPDVKRDIVVAQTDQSDVKTSLTLEALSASDKKELNYWQLDELENPNGDLFCNILHKADFMKVFSSLTPCLAVTDHAVILELGAGHGWASALLKRQYPDAYIVASDVSADAIGFSYRYENLLGSRINEKWAISATDMPFEDAQFSIIFAFAAFHHFIIGNRYDEVVREVFRVLKPGGRLVLLYEPSAPQFLYRQAFNRINGLRKVDEIDEDVIQLSLLTDAVRRVGGDIDIQYYTENRFRGVKQTLYYTLVGALPLLTRLIPCTVNIFIAKPG